MYKNSYVILVMPHCLVPAAHVSLLHFSSDCACHRTTANTLRCWHDSASELVSQVSVHHAPTAWLSTPSSLPPPPEAFGTPPLGPPARLTCGKERKSYIVRGQRK